MRKKKATTVITTILGEGAVIKGDFIVENSARIDGQIIGNVKAGGTLIVGAGGRLESDRVEAVMAIIGGEVIGNITVEEKMELTATARVLGDIDTKTLVIDEHAIFQGRCNMNQEIPTSREGRDTAPKTSKGAKRSAKAALQEALKAVEEQQKVEGQENAAESAEPPLIREIPGEQES